MYVEIEGLDSPEDAATTFRIVLLLAFVCYLHSVTNHRAYPSVSLSSDASCLLCFVSHSPIARSPAI